MNDWGKRIVVISLRYLGDAIWTIPFLRNLKRNLPHSEISVVVYEGADAFLRLLPEVSEVITLRRRRIKGAYGTLRFLGFLLAIRKRRFDTAFVLTNSDRPTVIAFVSGARNRVGCRSDKAWRRHLLTHATAWDQHRFPHHVEYNLQILSDVGFTVFDRSLDIAPPPVTIERIAERFGLRRRDDVKTILVHPGARTALRRWRPEHFAGVINTFSADCSIFLVGGPGEEPVIQVVLRNLARPPALVTTDLTPIEFAALCTFADLFVGNDSAPIHIAAATGLEVIGLYGPTRARYCAPWTEKRTLFDLSTLPCRMCSQERCVQEVPQACLEVITPEMVIDRIHRIFGSSSPRRDNARADCVVHG